MEDRCERNRKILFQISETVLIVCHSEGDEIREANERLRNPLNIADSFSLQSIRGFLASSAAADSARNDKKNLGLDFLPLLQKIFL